jgi:hypothetical protein
MKKNASFLIFFLAVIAFGLSPVVADAQDGAVVIKDTSCMVLDVDAINTFDVYDTVKVTTPSRNNNRNVSCHGDLPDGSILPDNAVVYNFMSTGWKCCVNFDGVWLATENWHEVITPSGNVSLTCHYKGDEIEQCQVEIPQ